jgi:hypothetical protein
MIYDSIVFDFRSGGPGRGGRSFNSDAKMVINDPAVTLHFLFIYS